mgnify:CR=1 FL=1
MSELPKTILGRTNIQATRLGFGAMALRDATIKWPMEDDHAEAVLNTVLDCGINFIDTADCYGYSEARIGRYISHRRDEFTLATKCGCLTAGAEGERGATTPVGCGWRWCRWSRRRRCGGHRGHHGLRRDCGSLKHAQRSCRRLGATDESR